MCRGKDAEDRVRFAFENDDAADDGKVGVEARGPEVVVQYHDLVGIAFVVAAAVCHGCADHGEEVLGRYRAEDAPGFIAVVPVGVAFVLFAGQVGEDAAAARELDHLVRGMAVAAEADADERAGVGHGRLAQQEFGGEGKQRRVGADAETQ